MCSPRIRGAGPLASLLLGALLARAAHGQSPPQPPSPQNQKGQQSSVAVFTLADFERIALERNPTLAQAAARIEMSKGKALQAGLYPNPTIGYQGEQIGAAGTAGERQGGFIQQEIVTAGKLRLSRAKYQQEAFQAELQMLAQQLRVANGVQIAFYEVLATQQSIETDRALLRIADEGVKTVKELVNVGQANQPDLLQAEVEANRARVALRKAEQQYLRNWERLITMAGAPELPPTALVGQLLPSGPPLDHKAALCRLLEESPELKVAQAEVVRDQISLKRERVEPIPNVTVQAATGYNFETKNTTADVQFGIRLPIFDRNRGTIRQAQGELARAQAEVTRTELVLRRRLADAFQRYQTAFESVEDFQKSSLPKARQAADLYQDFFRKRRAAWPQVIVAERTYAQLAEEYTSALIELRRAEIEINGLLLTNGLDQPPGPVPQGHIEVSPRPR